MIFVQVENAPPGARSGVNLAAAQLMLVRGEAVQVASAGDRPLIIRLVEVSRAEPQQKMPGQLKPWPIETTGKAYEKEVRNSHRPLSRIELRHLPLVGDVSKTDHEEVKSGTDWSYRQGAGAFKRRKSHSKPEADRLRIEMRTERYSFHTVR